MVAAPSNLDFEIPAVLKVTNNQEHFILFDSGPSDINRIIVFGTKANLEHLANNPHWYADGTFDTAPVLFKQVFTLHVIIGGYIVPMVYALLPDKK